MVPFGFGSFLCSLYWITNSLTFDEKFKILIPFGLILIPLFLSLFFSILTLNNWSSLNLNFSSILLISAGLAFSDYIRGNILTGFPRIWKSYSFSWATEIIQILNKIGLFSFNLISYYNFYASSSIFFQNRYIIKKFFTFIFVLLSLFSLYIYGSQTINKNQKKLEEIEEKYYLKVVSPNFDLNYNLSREKIKKRLRELIKYSEPSEKFKNFIRLA